MRTSYGHELPKLREHAEYVARSTLTGHQFDDDPAQVFMRADVAVIQQKPLKAEADPLIASVRILRQAQEIRHGRPRAHDRAQLKWEKRCRNTRADERTSSKSLRCTLAQTALYFTPRHSDACDMGTFRLDRWVPMQKRLRADLDELFYEILPETRPQSQLVNM